MEREDRKEKTEVCQKKNSWITPEVFDSPVIAVTEGAPGTAIDGQEYS